MIFADFKVLLDLTNKHTQIDSVKQNCYTRQLHYVV